MHEASVGNTALQPAVVGEATHADNEGSTALQPATDESAVHAASEGNTALQPAVVGEATHADNVGSTALQPATDESAVHAASVGNTAPQPAADGFVMHCANDGADGSGDGLVYSDGISVVSPVNGPEAVIAPPANSPTVLPDTVLSTVSVLGLVYDELPES